VVPENGSSTIRSEFARKSPEMVAIGYSGECLAVGLDGAGLEPQEAMDPLRPGDPRQVGVYRLVGRLGDGGMGQVFLGVSPGGRPVAVKVRSPESTA
jgi:serine/threonine protein kinase